MTRLGWYRYRPAAALRSNGKQHQECTLHQECSFSFDISPKLEVRPCLGGLHASAMISPARWAAPLPDSRRVRRPPERRSVRLGPFVVGIHREHCYRPRRPYRVTSRQSDGSFRCDRPLRDGLGRRSARLGSSGIQSASGPRAGDRADRHGRHGRRVHERVD
jgi:hypothetical protein